MWSHWNLYNTRRSQEMTCSQVYLRKEKIQDRISQGKAPYSVFLHFLERDQNMLEAVPDALSPPAVTPALQRAVCSFPTCQLQREPIPKKLDGGHQIF